MNTDKNDIPEMPEHIFVDWEKAFDIHYEGPPIEARITININNLVDEADEAMKCIAIVPMPVKRKR